MRKTIFLSIFLLSLVNFCFAQPNEFTPLETSIDQREQMEPLSEFTQISRSRYFNIYSQKGANLLRLIRQLNIRSEYLLLKGASAGDGKPQDLLAAIVDAIFLETSDVLHMYLYSFIGNIKICQNQKELNKAFRESFHQDLNARSFYARKTNSIYISMQNMQPETLAYEIAHAIISLYYVVLPPVAVRETLAKDAGYQIKKLAK